MQAEGRVRRPQHRREKDEVWPVVSFHIATIRWR
jgi:hypothetical protein